MMTCSNTISATRYKKVPFPSFTTNEIGPVVVRPDGSLNKRIAESE